MIRIIEIFIVGYLFMINFSLFGELFYSIIERRKPKVTWSFVIIKNIIILLLLFGVMSCE